MSTCPLVELNNVSLSFKRRKLWRVSEHQVLKNITVSVRRGETLGVVGRNGCGKSTLLRVLAGIYEPQSGNILRHSKKISLLSLSLGFDGNLSGRDNAILSGMLLGNSRRKVTENLAEIIKFSELDDFIDAPIRTYSSGMRARLGFSVAITMRADLLLIDEVLGVGDTRFREKAVKVMREKLSGDQSVVFVSHNERQIRALCDRVLWLEKGTPMKLGEAHSVLLEYQNFLRDAKDLVV